MGDFGGTARRFARTWVVASLALAVTACTAASNSSSESASGLRSTLIASLSPPPADPIAAKAESIVRSLTTPSHPAAAAAFVTTTYAVYATSLPETAAGIQAKPSPSDVVILVEIEGYFPASHSCGFMMGTCHDTGIFVAFDQTLGQTLAVSYEDDPWSRDRPSPGPSVSQRFALVHRVGTPVTLQLP